MASPGPATGIVGLVPGLLAGGSWKATPRRGVTLIELMVVMMVIGILASLTLSGLLVARTSAKIARTTSTIRKLHEVIVPYYEEYENRRPNLPDTTALLALTEGRRHLSELRQTALRRLMTMELPERVTDVTESLRAYSETYGPPTNRVKMTLSEVPPVAHRYNSIIGTRDASSSELLHLIVTRGPVADPDIIAHFRPDEVADTDGDGLPEFIDGWSRPIAFRRWPTGFASPAQPIDGSLAGVDTALSDGGHRLVPLIFSAGPDESYDISALPAERLPPEVALPYATYGFDPFRFDPQAPWNPARSPIATIPEPRIRGEVVLVPVTRTKGPVTFAAVRLDASGEFTTPSVDAGCTASPDSAFFTVGSERDTGSASSEDSPNGRLESRDNIHNHDMAR
jgi:prepilin-type N-terminal cleavage/methylation domain-containing protein